MKKMDIGTLGKLGLGGLVALLIAVASLIGSYQSAPPADPALGAIPGDTIDGNKWKVGGLSGLYFGRPLFQGTTTPCAISPNATSTLVSAGILLNRGTTTAQRVVITKAANAYATTTLLGHDIFGIRAGGLVVATSSLDVVSTTLFTPSQYVVFGLDGGQPQAGGGGGTVIGDGRTGFCFAEFKELQ